MSCMQEIGIFSNLRGVAISICTMSGDMQFIDIGCNCLKTL